MNRALTVFLLFLLSLIGGRTETLLTQAKILEVTERGFVLLVGTEPLGVEDGIATKYWKDGAAAKRPAFGKGDSIHARIKTDSDPPLLREMADPATAKWLESIRRDPTKAVLEKIDAKYLHVKLQDGKSFSFRATDKTAVKLKGRANPTLMDLQLGQTVYVKGRLLPTLDTWLVTVSDEPIPAASSASKTKASAPKLSPLPPSGSLAGTVLEVFQNIKMFDLRMERRTVHVTYTNETRFFYQGAPVSAEKIKVNLRCSVEYRRDKSGRLIASKVEMFPADSP